MIKTTTSAPLSRHLWLVLPVLALLAAVSGPRFASADQPAPTATPLVIHMKNFAFVPDKATVAVGTTVVWKNDDSVAHTAAASGKDGFDSGNLDTGASFSHAFKTAGTFHYVCAYHPDMHGTLTVGNAPPAATATPEAPPSPSGY
jgi:manganese oxidase